MIIKSILDTDLYKFTTSYAYMKMFPNAIGTFTFVDRDNTKYTEEFVREFKMELCNMSRLVLTLEESMFMSKCRFIPKMYWEWLSSFRFDPNVVSVCLDVLGHLHIEVTDYLYKATLYEVPILALVSELRGKMLGYTVDIYDVVKRLSPKISLSNDNEIKFSEFGTRRRFNFNVQNEVIRYISQNSQYCTGTSNCYLAMKYSMKPMGTHPHEWFMFHGAQFGYKHANYLALENWGVGFDSYPSEYPGKYIGLSEEEYEIFIDLLNSGDDLGIKGEICECLRDRTEYSFLVFQGASVYYYDIFNTKFNVELE